MLPATEHAPVHIADVITAIGKLRKTKLDTGAIAAALGYAELEIKRLEALAAVHPNVLKALRAGKLTLKQVRLFARIGDKKQQAEIAQTALDGYFQDYQLKGLVTRGRVTVDDPRFTLVGMDRYVAAGGRVSSDLFAELPDALLDPEVLTTAWRERVQPIVAHLQAEGLAVYLGDDGDFGAPEGFSRLPYVYRPDLTEAQTTALNEANYRVTQLSSALQDIDPQADDAPGAFGPLVSAMAAVAGAPLSRCKIGAVILSPAGSDYGFAASFYSVPLPGQRAAGGDRGRGRRGRGRRGRRPLWPRRGRRRGAQGRCRGRGLQPRLPRDPHRRGHARPDPRPGRRSQRGPDGPGGAAVQAAGPALLRAASTPRRCRSQACATAGAPPRRSRRWTAR